MKNFVNDLTLVEARYEKGVCKFFITIFIVLISLTLAWGEVAEKFSRFKIPFCYTTAESNIADLVKGLWTLNPDIAIVGSSLSKRLSPGLFSDINVINLGIGGGSVMTGLEILRSSANLPSVILIETNILDRPVDKEEKIKGKIAAESKLMAILSGVTKPLRYIFTKPLFSYPPPMQQTILWKTKRINLLSQSAATYDIQSVVAAGRLNWDKRDNWDIADQNLRRIKQLIPELESRGAKVFLLNLPYSDGYDIHQYAKRNRSIASGNESFHCQRCIDLRQLVDVGQLRWGDGTHLDDKSAAIAAEALQSYLLSTTVALKK